jgi:hypothetical protein
VIIPMRSRLETGMPRLPKQLLVAVALAAATLATADPAPSGDPIDHLGVSADRPRAVLRLHGLGQGSTRAEVLARFPRARALAGDLSLRTTGAAPGGVRWELGFDFFEGDRVAQLVVSYAGPPERLVDVARRWALVRSELETAGRIGPYDITISPPDASAGGDLVVSIWQR